jgi:glycosyltransferase involved in cell wall biosynthesis
MNPLVSVIIPAYNAAQYIAEAIYSALNQTYKELEVIVVDDGSTDGTSDIIQGINDSRLILIKQHNKGGSAARNHGLEAAKGEYIKFLDADDVLYPDTIEKQIKESEHLGKNDIIFGDFNFINSKGQITETHSFKDQELLSHDPITFFLANWKILISCPLHKKKYLQSIGGFDEKLPFGQEADLHFRLALKGYSFIHREGPVFFYRSHVNDSRISANRLKKNRDLWAMVYGLDKRIKLLMERNGSLNDSQKEYFSRSFFGLARKSFLQSNKAEGKYYLSRSKQYSKNKLPPFKRTTLWGLFYLISGSVLGYSLLEKLIRRIRGNSDEVSEELSILLKQ